jgi:hypothetical protein
VTQAPAGARFAAEPRQELRLIGKRRRDHLERDDAVGAEMHSPEHRAMPPRRMVPDTAACSPTAPIPNFS